MGDHSALQPTQVAFSAQAVKRTIVQVLIPALLTFVVIVPLIIQIILDGYGQQMPDGLRGWLVAAGGFVVVSAGVLAKIMAIPQVNALLRSWGLGAQPK
jgi:hypothetical protein